MQTRPSAAGKSGATNSTGGIVEASDYYPFGQERVVTDNLDNNYKYTGHEPFDFAQDKRDPESGLDHTLYRENAETIHWIVSPRPACGQD